MLIAQKQLCYDNLERMRWALEDFKAEIASKYEELKSMKGYDPATKEARAYLFEEIQQLKNDKKNLLEGIQEVRDELQDVKDELAGM
jgi:uncharacterized coiled-coil DUF342 family protein